MIRRRTACVLAFASIWTIAQPGAAAPKRFDLDRHLPDKPLLHLRANGGKLLAASGETSLGALLEHPRIRPLVDAGIDLYFQAIDSRGQFEKAIGSPLEEVVGWFLDDVSMTWQTVDFGEGPTMILTARVGGQRDKIADFMEKMLRLNFRSEELTEDSYRGQKIYRWPIGSQGFAHSFLADTLVVGLNGLRIEDVVDRFLADEKDGSLEGDGAFQSTMRRTAGGKKGEGEESHGLLSVYFESTRFQEQMLASVDTSRSWEQRNAEEFRQIWSLFGFDGCTSAGYQLNVIDGVWQGKLLFESPKGHRGMVAMAAALTGAPKSLDGLARVPAEAVHVGAVSIDKGGLLKHFRELLQTIMSLEQDAAGFDAFLGELDKRLGVSLRASVETLPAIETFPFTMRPPAGSLVPDCLTVVHREQAAPYLRIADRIARKLGGKTEWREHLGQKVSVRRLGALAKVYIDAVEAMPEGRAQRNLRDLSQVLSAVPSSTLIVSSAEVDEWVVFGSSPQAVARYLAFYSKMPNLAESPAYRERYAALVGRANAFALLRGRETLALYNALLRFTPLLEMLEKRSAKFGAPDPSAPNSSAPSPSAPEVGLEEALAWLGEFPPAEAFTDRFHDALLRVRTTERSILFEGRGVASHTAGATVLPIVAMVGWMVPMRATRARVYSYEQVRDAQDEDDDKARNAKKPPERSYDGPFGAAERVVQSADRIHRLALDIYAYMEKTGSRAYPHSPEGGAAGLQKLIDAGVLSSPEYLVHPFSSNIVGKPDEEGRWKLSDQNSSYALVPWRQGRSDAKSRILAYEKLPFLSGGRWVLHVDLSSRFYPERQFQEMWVEQLGRFGKKKKEKGS